MVWYELCRRRFSLGFTLCTWMQSWPLRVENMISKHVFKNMLMKTFQTSDVEPEGRVFPMYLGSLTQEEWKGTVNIRSGSPDSSSLKTDTSVQLCVWCFPTSETDFTAAPSQILADMKQLCTFTISLLFLKFSLILCCWSEPSCFWRIKKSEDNDGDLQRECHFYLWKTDEPIEDSFYNYDLSFR